MVAAIAIFTESLPGICLLAWRMRCVKPGFCPPGVHSLIAMPKVFTKVLIPMDTCGRHHKQGREGEITAKKESMRERSTELGSCGLAGFGYSEGMGRAFLVEGNSLSKRTGEGRCKVYLGNDN